jgi:hypothetical protein
MDELGDAGVGSIQPNTHSFVVKVWLNDHAQRGGRLAWRGRITHVPSGHCRHFSRTSEVAGFIAVYLRQLGVRPALGWRVQRWLRR